MRAVIYARYSTDLQSAASGRPGGSVVSASRDGHELVPDSDRPCGAAQRPRPATPNGGVSARIRPLSQRHPIVSAAYQ